MKYLPFLLLFCACDHPDYRCASSASIVTPDTYKMIVCTPGASIRLDVVGDGSNRRNIVICDCVKNVPPLPDPPVVFSTPPLWDLGVPPDLALHLAPTPDKTPARRWR